MSNQNRMSEFQVLSKLGTGAFSEVFRAIRKSDGQEYALKKVKLMKLSEKEKENALNEVRILASIQHPNIVAYKEAFFEESTQILCIVMEFADGGDIQSKINQLKKEAKFMKEEDIWSIFYQMVLGLQTLHNLKIVHRDIKCANVFLTKDGKAKLGDLNVSKIAKMGILQTQTGTPYYASPEVWQDKPYDKRSDIWSLGCVLYELTTLNPPFTAKDMQGLYNRVLKGVYPKIPSQFSADLSTMIKALLQVNPQNRPSTNQILAMPVLISKYNEIRESKIKQDEQGGFEQDMMLGTIKIPKNLRLLSERLPKSNYGGRSESKDKDEIQELPIAAPEVVNDLHEIVEEDHSKLKKYELPQSVVAITEDRKQPMGVAPRQPRVRSERIGAVNSARSGLVQNQLQENQQQIVNKHKVISEREQNQSRLQSIPNENIQPIKDSQYTTEPLQEVHPRIQQYRKKIYNNDIPRTSPSVRNGIEDMYYQIAHGKGALMDRREKLKPINQNELQNVIPKREDLVPIVENAEQNRRMPIQSRKSLRYQMQRQNTDEPNSQVAAQQNKVNLPQLPQLNSGRNAYSNQITPKYVVPIPPSGRNLSDQYQIPSSYERAQIQYQPEPIMMQRAKSKDALALNNNLRDVYKQMAGVNRVVQEGRIEQQRMLMENYKKVEPSNYGYMLPINLKKHQHQQYIPMSQHGQRGVNNQYQSPQSRQYIPSSYQPPQQQPQSVRPSWWG